MSRERRASCVCCPAANCGRARWGRPCRRRPPRQPVAAPWCSRSWSTTSPSAGSTTRRVTSGWTRCTFCRDAPFYNVDIESIKSGLSCLAVVLTETTDTYSPFSFLNIFSLFFSFFLCFSFFSEADFDPDSYKIPFVIMSVSNLASEVHSLLQSHEGSLPLLRLQTTRNLSIFHFGEINSK